MKKFLINLFVVAILSLAAAALCQLLISLRIKNKTINGQDNFHTIKNQKNALVFLGSSRCSEHFDPKFLKDSLGLQSVNLGVNGHGDLTMQYLRLKYYLTYNAPPKVAILNFDPISTYGPFNISDNKNFIEKNYYARYAFWPAGPDTNIVNYFHFSFADKYIPLYALLRYRCIVQCITMNDAKTWNVYGYQRHTETWDTITHPLNEVHFAGYPDYIKDKDSLVIHMEFFKKYCESNNIKLICVQSPVFRTIYEKQAFDVTKEVCNKLGILFIDTNEDFIMNDIRNFADPDHLNTTGTPKMMNIIIKNKEFVKFFEH